MPRDVAPNLPNLLMTAVDKMRGNTVGIADEKGEIHLERATPETISIELKNRIATERVRLNSAKTFGQSTTDHEVNINWLTRAKNYCDMIQLGGVNNPFISQDRRGHVAYALAEAITKEEFSEPNDESRKRFGEVFDHIGAALGHKISIKKLAKEREVSKAEFQVEN